MAACNNLAAAEGNILSAIGEIEEGWELCHGPARVRLADAKSLLERARKKIETARISLSDPKHK